MDKALDLLINILIYLGITLALAVGVFFVIFIFWNIVFYPVYKKWKYDELINDNENELQKLRIDQDSVAETIHYLNEQKRELMDQIKSLELELNNKIKENKDKEKNEKEKQ